MQKANTKTEHILASVKCSSFGALIIFIVLIIQGMSRGMIIKGVPDWLCPAVERGLVAVWNEIPDNAFTDREATLQIVASRLFTGYEVKVNPTPEVIFKSSQKKIITPKINLILPDLREFALEWFKNDINGIEDKILNLVKDLPQDAYTWADEALREQINLLVKKILPGWEFTQQIFISNASTNINILFRPETPVIIAVEPELHSRILPAMLRNYLESKIIPALNPLIGVPVKWADVHKDEIEIFSRDFLEDRNAVTNMKGNVKILFKAAAISSLEASVDSEKFLFNLWVATYAGINERYPEFGALFSYRPGFDFNPEIFSELDLKLNNFDTIFRLGINVEPVKNFRAGIGIQWGDGDYFFTAKYSTERLKNYYAWWRWYPDIKIHESAAGYQFDEHIAIELYYNSSDGNNFGLRGLWYL